MVIVDLEQAFYWLCSKAECGQMLKNYIRMQVDGLCNQAVGAYSNRSSNAGRALTFKRGRGESRQTATEYITG